MLEDKDIDGLCEVSTEVYVEAAASALRSEGAEGEIGCTEVWEYIAANTSEDDLADPVTMVSVDGDTAHLMSGDDPWTLVWVDGGWKVATTA